jgi:hypothetical protein
MKWGDGARFSVHSCIKCYGFSDKLHYGHFVSFLFISFLQNYNISKLTYAHVAHFTLLLKGWISYPKSSQCSRFYTLMWFVCVYVIVSVSYCCHKTRAHLNVSQEIRSPARKLCVETILGPIHQPIRRTPVVMRSSCDRGHYLFRRSRGDLPPVPVRCLDLYRHTDSKTYCYIVCSLSQENSVNSW